MIPRARLDDIDEAVIRQLIEQSFRENRTLDFKEQLDLSKDGRQALAEDVCAFANTVGGDIVFGLSAPAGTAGEIKPVHVADLDAELLRLTNSLRDAVEPRVTATLLSHAVPLAGGGHVVVLRVGVSPNAPHRVIRGGQFFLRNSVGKEPMDIHAIRTGFAYSEGLRERALAWHEHRLSVLRQRMAPVRLAPGPLFVTHLLPLSALTRRDTHPLDALKAAGNELQRAKPAGHLLRAPEVNYEGMICRAGIVGSGAAPDPAFGQIFRDGSIELAGAVTIRQLGNPPIAVIPPSQYELPLVEYCLPALTRAVAALDVLPPAYLFVTVLGLAGQSVGFQSATDIYPQTATLPAHLDELHGAPVYVEDLGASPIDLARQGLAPLWNAIGEEDSKTQFRA